MPSSTLSLTHDTVICACEADWTAVDANAVVSDASETTYYKRGSRSVYIGVVAACTQGVLAYGASASAGLNLTRPHTDSVVGYTHLKYWIRCSGAALPAGTLKLGLSNAADASGTEYYVDIPAVAADTWTRVTTALSSDMHTNLNSVDSIHLWLEDGAWTGAIYLDDIRVSRYVSTGDAWTLPAASTAGNTNACTTDNAEVWIPPFVSRLVSIYDLPVDLAVTGYRGAAGDWSADDYVSGMLDLKAGQTAAELQREWTALALCMGSSDLASGDTISIEVVR